MAYSYKVCIPCLVPCIVPCIVLCIVPCPQHETIGCWSSSTDRRIGTLGLLHLPRSVRQTRLEVGNARPKSWSPEGTAIRSHPPTWPDDVVRLPGYIAPLDRAGLFMNRTCRKNICTVGDPEPSVVEVINLIHRVLQAA